MAEGVARALERVPPDQVVHVSSDAVYPFESGLVTERSCAQPTDLYGMMHLAREVLLRSTVRAPFAVLRPTLVYGAADPHNSYGANRFRRMARKDGMITLFGEGEETRDHVLVEDVARLALEVLRRRSEGLLNVATGRSVSFMALARMVAATPSDGPYWSGSIATYVSIRRPSPEDRPRRPRSKTSVRWGIATEGSAALLRRPRPLPGPGAGRGRAALPR